MAPGFPLRVLELYCGIGGCAAALDGSGAAEVVAALDINHLALAAYRRNFHHPATARTLESLAAAELAAWEADLWWLSPPCQPFTRRGLGRDLDDPRTASLLALADRATEVRPAYLALENVPGFAASRTHARLRAALDGAGYEVRERLLCPTELGVPNRRRRFHLLASRRGFATAGRGAPPPTPTGSFTGLEASRAIPPRRPLADFLDPEPAAKLAVDPGLLERYAGALDLVDPADSAAVAACFTAAYGRSPVHSGSYLVLARDAGGRPVRLRRFSPAEILRLLGFPAAYSLPPELSVESSWRLVGNSISVDVVRAVLAQIPGLAGFQPG